MSSTKSQEHPYIPYLKEGVLRAFQIKEKLTTLNNAFINMVSIKIGRKGEAVSFPVQDLLSRV